MLKRLFSLFVCSSIVVGASVAPSLAQTTESLTDALTFQFNPPNTGVPGNTTGGAARTPDRCRAQGAQDAYVSLLAPKSFVGLTVSDRPSFFIRAEEMLAKQLFVSIKDEQGETVYQGFQALSTDAELIPVELSADVPALDTDETYQVLVVLVCDTALRPDDPVLTGYVTRVSEPQATTEASLSNYEQARRYAESGIWYDTLTLLEQELRANPNDDNLLAAWDVLLQSGELTD